jgi:hypothetical protein
LANPDDDDERLDVDRIAIELMLRLSVKSSCVAALSSPMAG